LDSVNVALYLAADADGFCVDIAIILPFSPTSTTPRPLTTPRKSPSMRSNPWNEIRRKSVLDADDAAAVGNIRYSSAEVCGSLLADS
jgi:hypothetical protein